MKKTKRLWALLLAVVMALGLITTAFAAPTIDSGRKASLSLYKYDITAASADGAWDAASYVSTGVQEHAKQQHGNESQCGTHLVQMPHFAFGYGKQF